MDTLQRSSLNSFIFMSFPVRCLVFALEFVASSDKSIKLELDGWSWRLI